MKHITLALIMTALLASACRLIPTTSERPKNILKPDKPPTSEPQILADWFVTICTYLDVNNTGALEEADEPLGGVNFEVDIKGVTMFGGITSSRDGCYTITIPGSGAESLYPMTVTIKPPEGVIISQSGSESVELDYPNSHVDFLFAPPAADP